jgi:cytochrome c peroxidase
VAVCLIVGLVLSGVLFGLASANPTTVIRAPRIAGRALIGPPSLKAVPVPLPPDLDDFIADREAAIALGKALFWDMQLGSDGVTACATCHFHAGADNRVKNQASPGLLGAAGADTTFQVQPPNGTVTAADFPFHQRADPRDQQISAVVRTSNDALSSQGIALAQFAGVKAKKDRDIGTPTSDPVFNLNGRNLRRVAPRNTPSVVNAVFNFANLWDGAAHNIFNGKNPAGPSDQAGHIWVNVDGQLQNRVVRLANASLASQAVGAPVSDLLMSFSGRRWEDIGRKMLSLPPLRKQVVHPEDSILGGLSKASVKNGKLSPGGGLNTTYPAMIRAAFKSNLWDNTAQGIELSGSGATVIETGARAKLGPNQFTQMEFNFALFFGLSVMLYEATLVSDDSFFDRVQEGTECFTAQQQEGFALFTTQAGCAECHMGSELTNASVSSLTLIDDGRSHEFSAFANGASTVPATATAGFTVGRFVIDDAETKIDFVLTTTGVTETVSLIHLHVGAPGVEGPVLFPVFDAAVHGPLPATFGGTLTAADVFPPSGVATFAQALCLIRAGGVYLNMHTPPNQAPILRGQLYADGRMELLGTDGGDSFADVGFANTAVTIGTDDAGRGRTDRFSFPLAFSRLGILQRDNQLPSHLTIFVAALPPGQPTPPDRVAVDGAFKVPSLRNVELTGPYFHNGSAATLQQVVEFYARGGNFPSQNIQNLHEAIEPILALQGQPARQAALVAFLRTLTDERVRNESAPFDHPQLFVPHGVAPDGKPQGNPKAARRAGFAKDEEVIEVPPVGRRGRAAQGLEPLQPFLNLDPATP